MIDPLKEKLIEFMDALENVPLELHPEMGKLRSLISQKDTIISDEKNKVKSYSQVDTYMKLFFRVYPELIEDNMDKVKKFLEEKTQVEQIEGMKPKPRKGA